MYDDNDFKFDDDWRKEPTVKLKQQGGFFSNFFGGHHQSKYTVSVPEGVDPKLFSSEVSTSIAQSPAPGALLKTPGETPTKVKTIGQPSWVSKASSESNDDHNVMVEADPGHLLGGRNGTAAGINYHTEPRQRKDGTWKVVTEKESYGQSFPLLNPLRFLVGTTIIDSHIQDRISQTHDKYTKPSTED